MINVALVGTGTVSQQLERVISKADGVRVTQVLKSRGETLSEESKVAFRYSAQETDIEQPDIYIIAVSDDAIRVVSQLLAKSDKLVVHTSGSVAMTMLPVGTRRGVFYPLQTFSKEREVDFGKIPICLEAEQKQDMLLLTKLAKSISGTVVELSSARRRSIHLAAVFVNNFTNHLYQIGNKICEENNIPFSIFEPLINETAAKIGSVAPLEAQTGPAKRGDDETLAIHFTQIANPTHREVYRILTKSIKETYGKKL